MSIDRGKNMHYGYRRSSMLQDEMYNIWAYT